MNGNTKDSKMRYQVTVCNNAMEQHDVESNSPIDAARMAAAKSVIDLAACNRAQVDIRVEWNHRTVKPCDPKNDIFGGLLKQETFDTCDRAWFWWDETGIVEQDDASGIME